MKLKGVNPIEQHIEKIVLALVAAVFLAVLAFQFLYEPNRVEIEPGRKVAPELAFAPVENLARQVASDVNAVNVDIPEPEPINLAQRLELDAAERITRIEPIRPLGRGHTFEGAQVAPTITGGRFEVARATPPPPAAPLAAVHRGTFDPYFVARNPEFAELLPDEQPFDKASVTVQATFSGNELTQALLEDPDGEQGPIRPLPTSWWRDSVAIVAVELQRQALTPEGTWAEPEFVARPPGAPNLLGTVLAEARSPSDMIRALDDARSLAPDIQRPDYYPIIAGDSWATPVEVAEAEARRAREREATRTLNRYEVLIDRREGLETELGEVPEEQPAKRARLQRQIEAVAADIEEVVQELDAMGVDPEEGIELAARHDPTRFAPRAELLADDQRHVWTHDLTAAPGETYRYRIRVHINNPIFGRGDTLVEEQIELARSPSLAGAWSEWSEPVRVAPETLYFVTSATVGEGISRVPRVSVELYRFFYGYWRRGVTSVQPGDLIEAGLDLPEPELIPIYDLADVEAEADAPGVAPPPGRGRPPPAGGGGNVAPIREPDRPTRGSGTAQRTDEEDYELPENAQPGPEELSAALGEYLVDVADSPLLDPTERGSRARPTLAYFGDPAGTIVVRSPEDAAQTPAYERLKQSAELGLRQGRPEPEDTGPSLAEIRRQRQEERREEREQRDRDIRRGKGGGGGGGG